MEIECRFKNIIEYGDAKIKLHTRHASKSVAFIAFDGDQVCKLDTVFSPVDQLRITLYDRTHAENKRHEVEIKEIIIDGTNLQQFIFDGAQWPNYDPAFALTNPPKSYCPGTTFHHNGTYELDISIPIWKFIVEKWNDSIS